MFSLDGKSLKGSGWCMLPEDNKSLTISAGGKSKTYEGEDYEQMLAEVGAIVNVEDRPTKWVYLLGKALKEWHASEKPENEIDDIKAAQVHLIAYCEILTGKKCEATGNYYEEDSSEAQWVVQDSNKEVRSPVLSSSRFSTTCFVDDTYPQISIGRQHLPGDGHHGGLWRCEPKQEGHLADRKTGSTDFL